jgi:hypothetical protein
MTLSFEDDIPLIEGCKHAAKDDHKDVDDSSVRLVSMPNQRTTARGANDTDEPIELAREPLSAAADNHWQQSLIPSLLDREGVGVTAAAASFSPPSFLIIPRKEEKQPRYLRHQISSKP